MALGEEEGHLEEGEGAEEEAFHLAGVEVVAEGGTPVERKERAPLGLQGRVHLGLKHRQLSEKVKKTGQEKVSGRSQVFR